MTKRLLFHGFLLLLIILLITISHRCVFGCAALPEAPPVERFIPENTCVGEVCNIGDDVLVEEEGMIREVFNPADFLKKKCIHGSSRVLLPNLQTVRADSLRVGDHVLAFTPQSGVHSSKIIQIPIAEPGIQRIFMTITTESGQRIRVTPEHGVYGGDCEGGLWSLKSAEDLKLGECVPRFLRWGEFEQDPIVEIEESIGRGVYQPISETGTVILSNVVVSCYDKFKLAAGINQEAGRIIAGTRSANSLLQMSLQIAKQEL